MTEFSGGAEFFNYLKEYGIEPFHVQGGVIYKYVKWDTAMAIVTKGTLKYGTADKFNDPFELSNDFFDTTATKHQIEQFVNQTSRMVRRERRLLIHNLVKNPQKLAEAYRHSTEAMKKLVGICCFSEVYDSPLMWSHYAEEHAGICLGFYISPLSSPASMICKVKYTNKITPISYFNEKYAAVFCWLLTISEHWKYEREVRSFFPNQNGFIPFDKRQLTKVFYGVRTSKEKVVEFGQALSAHGFAPKEIAKMEMVKGSFEFEAKPIRL